MEGSLFLTFQTLQMSCFWLAAFIKSQNYLLNMGST
nr:MAG TPA: hypothetical protein [Caudoviricetes sp.]